MTWENETCLCGLGGKLLLNIGKQRIWWSRASDAGRVTADVAHPCLSSPDNDFFLVFSIQANWGGKSGNRWSVNASPRKRREGVELEVLFPILTFLPPPCFTFLLFTPL